MWINDSNLKVLLILAYSIEKCSHLYGEIVERKRKELNMIDKLETKKKEMKKFKNELFSRDNIIQNLIQKKRNMDNQ